MSTTKKQSARVKAVSSKPSNQEMKEALAVLHQFRDALAWRLHGQNVSEEDKQLREQLYAAFSTLDKGFYGEKVVCNALCQICYLQHSGDLEVQVKNGRLPLPVYCCQTCLDRLKAEKRWVFVQRFDYKLSEYVIVERADDTTPEA